LNHRKVPGAFVADNLHGLSHGKARLEDYYVLSHDRVNADGGGIDAFRHDTVEHVAFQRIKSLADLDAGVAVANQTGKPAMLDFYADWCVECIRMERNTFGEPEIQALFGEIQLLQADVTANDETDQALMAKYDIFGPPAILFFDRQGLELPEYSLVGFYEVDEFAEHLRKVLGTN
jgi:thiol:disulfide interchange protein DsbD